MKLKKAEIAAVALCLMCFCAVLGFHAGRGGLRPELVLEERDDLTVSARRGTNTGSEQTGLVNINTATAEQLEQLYGIGPVLAARIIEFREANGPFARIEDIALVPGIASRTYKAISELICVE